VAGYVGSIEKQTLGNSYFREVLFTGKHAQLVVMCLQPAEEIGNEVHANVDQFFRIGVHPYDWTHMVRRVWRDDSSWSRA